MAYAHSTFHTLLRASKNYHFSRPPVEISYSTLKPLSTLLSS